MRIGQPKQQNWQNSETAENVTKELQTLLEGVQTTFSEKDKDEPKKPNYSSVAWVDDDTIAVVDKKKIKNLSAAQVKVISSLRDGLVCKSTRGILYLFDKSLNLKKTISEASTLLTCTSQSSEVCWMSDLTKICILSDGDCKEINIHEPNTTSNLCKPKFGHVLRNSMLSVSDWDKKCVFLIRRTG